jgi:hypothetical protein
MVSFEQEFKQYLRRSNIAFTDNCRSCKLLDFTLPKFIGERSFHLDVKEKRQRINTRNWPSVTESEEPFRFIIDDLAARKILAHAPYAGLLVRNNLTALYYWFSSFDLALMPKTRVNRPIEKKARLLKGKWIIDFRNAQGNASLDNIIETITDYSKSVIEIATVILPCFGNYVNETIPTEGETRKPGHWTIDVNATK